MLDSVLVPMDGSPLSERALRVALTEHADAEITVLHVIDLTEPGYSYPIEFDPDSEPLHGSEEWLDRSNELSDQLFDDVRQIADEHGVDVETETTVGRPEREIVDYVEDHGIDGIVMGSHGRDEDARVMLGTVAEIVAFRAPVRVTLVR